ncbi:MAG: type II toxin-antitoxin system VapC family toxin [Boseongicola sp. SB0677_bin_26]|nr:type II toxin-antitoxin system VapC family toxin [Boseongicola sp. SB0665_bin_10]MYG25080.1 type II toxin-antitoxin system VapC family toxin [Boseongicola sp. SB0677_bin_26]
MRILVDTQALLWWLMDSERLGAKARRIFVSGEPVVSPVVLWEIAIKASLGKLSADVSEVSRVIAEQGLERLGISDRHMISLQALPFHHRDPFGRMLIAQSEAEAMPLLTSDTKIARYGIAILDSTK